MDDLELAAELRALEETLLRCDVRRDRTRIAELLTDDFREFGKSGRIFTKDQIIASMVDESAAQITLTAFDCNVLAEGVAHVTYRATRREAEDEVVSLRSSLWVLRAGRWQVLFHQGTRAA